MTDFTTSYSAFIPEIWSQKLKQILKKNCVMMQCVNRNWEGEITNQGDKVKIITPADVTVSYEAQQLDSQAAVLDRRGPGREEVQGPVPLHPEPHRDPVHQPSAQGRRQRRGHMAQAH